MADPPEVIKRKITESPHSRFPVCEGALDSVLGIVQVKDLLVQGFVGQPFDIRGLLSVPLFLYEATPGLKVLEMFKSSGTHFAIVLDEYGLVEGLLTLNDILEAIVGDMPNEAEVGDQRAVKRPDGSWLLDGMLSIDEFQDLFEPVNLPEGDYETLAGFVLTQLGASPPWPIGSSGGGSPSRSSTWTATGSIGCWWRAAMSRSDRGRSRTRDRPRPTRPVGRERLRVARSATDSPSGRRTRSDHGDAR